VLETGTFWHSNQGCHPREARSHLFALRAINRNLHGILILDGDNRNIPEQDIRADSLDIYRWQRYEIENYILHPEALKRFVTGQMADLFAAGRASSADAFVQKSFPPDAINDPLGDNPYLLNVPASKQILPQLFKHLGMDTTKSEYFEIVTHMKPEEIHPEVISVLDMIYEKLT
jgi:hypothetical protein